MYKVVDPHRRPFSMLHCWRTLRHEQKWKDFCSQQNQKVSSSASLGNTSGSNESHQDIEGECHTSTQKDARPPGKKKAKEQQR